MFNNILIVCIGNICRSPTAEYLLKEKLGDSGKTIHSAGLGALVGKGIEPTAAALLVSHKIDGSAHKARQLEPKLIAEADLVLTMETGHIKGILAMAPEARGKTFLLGKWQGDKEIPDPYRKSEEMFKQIYKLIDEATASWVKMIQK